MNSRIRSIIREEIDKYLLKEQYGYDNLDYYGDVLESELNNMSSFDTSKLNDEVKKFFNDLEYFTIQVIFAIRRCVSGQTLNEGLSDYGIDVPSELTFWSDAKRGYQSTKNFMNLVFARSNARYSNTNKASNVANQNDGSDQNTDPNNVKSEKLMVLLQRINEFKQRKANIESKYNVVIDNFSNAPKNIIYYLENVEIVVNDIQQQNAQGNP